MMIKGNYIKFQWKIKVGIINKTFLITYRHMKHADVWQDQELFLRFYDDKSWK